MSEIDDVGSRIDQRETQRAIDVARNRSVLDGGIPGEKIELISYDEAGAPALSREKCGLLVEQNSRAALSIALRHGDRFVGLQGRGAKPSFNEKVRRAYLAFVRIKGEFCDVS